MPQIQHINQNGAATWRRSCSPCLGEVCVVITHQHRYERTLKVISVLCIRNSPVRCWMCMAVVTPEKSI